MSSESVALTIVFWTIFALQHSLLAQRPAKALAQRILGERFVEHGYRFCYFVSQCFVYPVFWYIVSHFEPGPVLWRLPRAFLPAQAVLRIVGHLLIVVSLLAADINRFVGLKQLASYLRSKLTAEASSSAETLVSGRLIMGFPYTIVRHPMYLGIILSLATATDIYTERLVLNLACLIAYVEIGSYFEERQLISAFGEQYRRYRQETPKWLPLSAARLRAVVGRAPGSG